MSIEEFFKEIASNRRLRKTVDYVFEVCGDNEKECGWCIVSVIKYYYYKWLFTRKIDPKIAEELRKCLRYKSR